MLLNTAILALLGVSFVVALLVILSGFFALQVVRRWDLTSGSETQLAMERKTYLISTLLAYAFVCEILSLFLFIYNAEQMSPQFVGAMCATGVLNINIFGWPTLLLKITVFLLGALWLMLNRIDNKGYDYPLIRTKYRLLLVLVPLMVAEAVTQSAFFLQMDPDIITSCCGSLFSADAQGVAAELAAVAPDHALGALLVAGAVLLFTGLLLLLRGTGGLLFAATSLASFVIALAAVVSVISLYVYEQPHHHCPFCVLKPGYDFIGYWLYLPLFSGAAFGIGAGILTHFRHIPTITDAVRVDARRFTILALLLFGLFYAIACYAIIGSHLVLLGE
jgi:hypothetical protein